MAPSAQVCIHSLPHELAPALSARGRKAVNIRKHLLGNAHHDPFDFIHIAASQSGLRTLPETAVLQNSKQKPFLV